MESRIRWYHWFRILARAGVGKQNFRGIFQKSNLEFATDTSNLEKGSGLRHQLDSAGIIKFFKSLGVLLEVIYF